MTPTRPPPHASRDWMWHAPEGILEMSILRLFRIAFAAAILAAAIPVQAAVAMAPAPFAHGNAELGNPLNDKTCVGCHARRFGGDANQIYFLSERRGGAPAPMLGPGRSLKAKAWTGVFSGEGEKKTGYFNKTKY